MEQDRDTEKSARGISRRTFLLGGSAILGGGALGDALYREPRDFEVREVTIPLEKIPPGRELRLVHLSDLHIRAFHGYYREVAEAVNTLSPEIILLTGDYLEQSRKIGEVRRFLRLLQASQGVFAIQGNWDYRARVEGENLRRHFVRAGVTLLINERPIWTCREYRPRFSGSIIPQKATISRGCSKGPIRPASTCSSPMSRLFPTNSWTAASTSSSAATPTAARCASLSSPSSTCLASPGAFVDGLYRVGSSGTPLYVTRGVGTSVFPVRFLCRPEITCMRLVAA